VLFLAGVSAGRLLLDLLQHETPVALARMTYATTLLLMAAPGLSVVLAGRSFCCRVIAACAGGAAAAGLRALASFVGAWLRAALQQLPRTVLHVGPFALKGNTSSGCAARRRASSRQRRSSARCSRPTACSRRWLPEPRLCSPSLGL
jgi:hypothetical protein